VTHRRHFVGVAVCALLLGPLATRAQTPEKIRRIGMLTGFSRADMLADALRAELNKLGWVDGQNIVLLEPRAAEGRNERLPALAEEVVRLDPAAIVVQSAPATRALKLASRSIPIVMVAVGDPAGYGLVDSLARPGGNVTGTSYLVNEGGAKLVEILKDAVPTVSSLALFFNPANEGAAPYASAVRAAADSLHVRLQALEVRAPGDFDAAFAAVARERTEAMLMGAEPLVRSQLARMAEFATKHRLLLAVHAPKRFLVSGALLSYAPKTGEFPRLTAILLDRILKGAKPGEMPIMQPTEFELAISLKTAKALGLTIPQSLLLRADEVIQ